MTKHTPGPWKWEKAKEINQVNNEPKFHIVSESDKTNIADVWTCLGLESGNAKLLSAAPDLLEACKEALEKLAQLDSESGTLGDRMRQAISNAEKEG